MSDGLAQQAAGIFRTRLQSLSNWMDKAEASADGTALVAARLAPDMHPFPWQIVFTCNQPNEFLAWCGGGTHNQPDPTMLDWAALKAHVAETAAALDAAVAAGITAPSGKHIDLMGSAHLDLGGQRYVDEWLLPNFYFHLVTSYALLRMSGVDIGKIDYMAHLHGDVRPNA